MKRGEKHTVEARIKQSLAASARHAKSPRRRRLSKTEAALQQAANRLHEGDLDFRD